MQTRAQRSKPLTRVFVRTRAGADVGSGRCASAATCVRAITQGCVVLVSVFAEADHVQHSTCFGAGG
jgi:hypothetical protein